MREALARLEMDGLVIKEPLRGYSIAPILDAAAFEQLYEVRGLIEPFTARRMRACESPAAMAEHITRSQGRQRRAFES